MDNKQNTAGTEQKILMAARKVFTTNGLAGARMQDIADEAGINKAMLHYYFRDKDKLFETVFMQEAQKFFPKIKMIFESEMPFFEKLERFVAEYVDEILENPYLPWFIFNEINRDPRQFLVKLMGNETRPIPMKFLEQMEKEVQKGTIHRVSPLHLFLNLLSMTIFPFIAKQMLTLNLGLDELQFRQIMEQRKKEVPQFIMNAIRK